MNTEVPCDSPSVELEGDRIDAWEIGNSWGTVGVPVMAAGLVPRT